MPGDIFGCHTEMRVCEMLRANSGGRQGSYLASAGHRAASITKKYPAPNGHCAKVSQNITKTDLAQSLSHPEVVSSFMALKRVVLISM